MSAEARYRPKPVEGDIPEDEIEYVELFGDLADVLEESDDAQRLVLLLSTCRNVWMTINAVFVDIKMVIGYRDLYDKFSEMLFLLGRGDATQAMESREEINRSLGQVEEKVEVWRARDALMGDLHDAISSRQGTSRSRLNHFMGRQRERRATPVVAHGQYLALDLETVPAKAEELLGVLVGSKERLLELSNVSASIAPMSAALGPVFDGARDDDPQATIFAEDPEALGRTVRAVGAEVWPEINEALSDAARIVPDLRGCAERIGEIDGATLDVDGIRVEFTGVVDALKECVDAEQEMLANRFPENVATRPMPAPFQVDLSRTNNDGKGHGERFKIETRVGRADQERDTARIGLLCCGLPERAYSHVNPNEYVFDDDAEARAHVVEAAKKAIDVGRENGCVLLAMPEVFVPRAYIGEIAGLAHEAGVAVVSGVEYRQGTDHQKAINEAMVALPGVHEVMGPRKQRPSVYEVREGDFEGDGKLWFFKHTAVGNLGVIICSDYLELDVVTDLASASERLDTLIVCARNPAPAVFEALAKADAMRLYASVVVVNARPDRGDGDGRMPSSGEGSLVAVPTHDGLLPPLGGDVAIDGPWEGDAAPALRLYDLPLSAIRARDRRRPAVGFLPAPFYARKLGD